MSRARTWLLALALAAGAEPALAQSVSSGLFSSGSGAAQSATFRLRSHAIGQAIGGSPAASASYGLAAGAQLADAAGLDSDGDGLTDLAEVSRDGDPSNYQRGVDTHPLDPDTDDDGLLDGVDPYPVGGPPIPALPTPAGVALAALLLGFSLARAASHSPRTGRSRTARSADSARRSRG